MAQESRQIQTQAQQQVQNLTPQQLQVVRLLELPVAEFEDRVRAELIDNPALEEGSEEPVSDDYSDSPEAEQQRAEEGDTSYDSLDDYRNEDDIPDYKLQSSNGGEDRKQVADIPFSDATSFYETLIEQLNEQDINEKQYQIAEYILGSLDDDGLLRKSLDTLGDELAIYVGIDASVKDVSQALTIVQSFDPAGIGARTLQECLLLQIERHREQQPTDLLLPIEARIVTDCYDEFTRKHWDKIASRLDIEDDVCQEAIREICKLNPRPGASMGEDIGKNNQQIIPDFLVETSDDGTITLSLCDKDVPQLRMSRQFTTLVEEHTRNKANQSKESRDTLLYLKQKMDSARNFIDAIRQRQNTLLTTMQAIIDFQRPFFLEGDESLLRPMILKDVAERAGRDISTVSRVTNSKYVQTNFGLYSLRFFFNDGFTTDSGEEVSTREIKRLLLELIDGEDKRAPLSDEQLCARLNEKGYPLARRTIAKYRKQFNIPVARLRK